MAERVYAVHQLFTGKGWGIRSNGRRKEEGTNTRLQMKRVKAGLAGKSGSDGSRKPASTKRDHLNAQWT